MDTIKNPEVAEVFRRYPQRMRQKLLFLRQLVLDTASETEGVGAVEETLKWGEPSYVSKGGSTIRMDWKDKNPHQYAMYFHCKTKLVDTFKELYRDKFEFEGNRAIVFNEDDEIPIEELKHCIALSLTYRSRKHITNVGHMNKTHNEANALGRKKRRSFVALFFASGELRRYIASKEHNVDTHRN